MRPQYIEKARKLVGRRTQSLGERRIVNLQAEMEHAAKVELLRGITTFKKNVDPEELRRAFESGNYEGLKRAIDDKDFAASLRPVFSGVVQDAVERASTKAIGVLPKSTAKDLRFDATNPNIKAYVQQQTGALITTSEQGLRSQLKRTVTRALNQGIDSTQAAKEIRGAIGLNERQTIALANYRNTLQVQAAKKELRPGSVDKLVNAYENRMLDSRALIIARTEVRNAINQGEKEVWATAIDQGLVPDHATKTWRVDGNPCPEWCQQMDGDAIEVNESWVVQNTVTGESKIVSTPSEVHPCCMCFADYGF